MMLATLATLATLAAPAPVDATPPCVTEDSTGRCVWDARHLGNGTGRSFVVRASGRVVYVTHARAHLLLTTSR